MKITAEPRSDQWNADDFIGGPRTFTIAGVKPGSAEQKYDIELVEGEGRAWRPPLTMLRLLIAAWGDEAREWQGRKVTLYRDSSIRFGPEAVGGIRISHMSDLPGNKPFEVRLTSARGKKSLHRVEPLPDTPTAPTAADVAACTDVATLRSWWQAAPKVVRASIEARVAELSAASEGSPQDDAPGYDEVPPSDDDLFGGSDG